MNSSPLTPKKRGRGRPSKCNYADPMRSPVATTSAQVLKQGATIAMQTTTPLMKVNTSPAKRSRVDADGFQTPSKPHAKAGQLLTFDTEMSPAKRPSPRKAKRTPVKNESHSSPSDFSFSPVALFSSNAWESSPMNHMTMPSSPPEPVSKAVMNKERFKFSLDIGRDGKAVISTGGKIGMCPISAPEHRSLQDALPLGAPEPATSSAKFMNLFKKMQSPRKSINPQRIVDVSTTMTLPPLVPSTPKFYCEPLVEAFKVTSADPLLITEHEDIKMMTPRRVHNAEEIPSTPNKTQMQLLSTPMITNTMQGNFVSPMISISPVFPGTDVNELDSSLLDASSDARNALLRLIKG